MPCPLPCTMGSHRIFISYQNPRVGGRNSCPVILPSMPGEAWGDTCLHLWVSVSVYHLWCEHLLTPRYRYIPLSLKAWWHRWSVSSTQWRGRGRAGKAIYQVWSRPAGSRPECLSSVDFQWIPFCWESELLPDKLHTTRWALSWTEFECLKNCENRSCSPAVF